MEGFTPCTNTLKANIATSCSNPRTKGYEQIGIIFNRADINWIQTAHSTDNVRIYESITLEENATPYVIYNRRQNPLPFDGTNTTFNVENNNYDKTVQFYFEGIGGKASKEVIEPLKDDLYVIMLYRKDHRGDGTFQLFGMLDGLKATAQVQDESTGYWLITMTCAESLAEVSFFKTDFTTSLTAYNAFLNQASPLT